MELIDLTPDSGAMPVMKMAFEQSIARHEEDIQEIYAYMDEQQALGNELSYVIEQALYRGVDDHQNSIDELRALLNQPWFNQ